MSFEDIFNLEMSKFYKKSIIFKITCFLAIANNLIALSLIPFSYINVEESIASWEHYLYNFFYNVTPFFAITTMLVVLIYPIYSITVDYKDRTFLCMIGFGIKPEKVYYTKILAVVLNLSVIFLLTISLPLLILRFIPNTDGFGTMYLDVAKNLTIDYQNSFYMIVFLFTLLSILICSIVMAQGGWFSILYFMLFYVFFQNVFSFVSNILTQLLYGTIQSHALGTFEKVLLLIVIIAFFNHISFNFFKKQMQ